MSVNIDTDAKILISWVHAYFEQKNYVFRMKYFSGYTSICYWTCDRLFNKNRIYLVNRYENSFSDIQFYDAEYGLWFLCIPHIGIKFCSAEMFIAQQGKQYLDFII